MAKYLDNECVLCYGVITDVTSHHAIFWQCKKYSYIPISKFIKIWRGCQKFSKSKSGRDNAPERSHRQSMPKIIKFFFCMVSKSDKRAPNALLDALRINKDPVLQRKDTQPEYADTVHIQASVCLGEIPE